MPAGGVHQSRYDLNLVVTLLGSSNPDGRVFPNELEDVMVLGGFDRAATHRHVKNYFDRNSIDGTIDINAFRMEYLRMCYFRSVFAVQKQAAPNTKSVSRDLLKRFMAQLVGSQTADQELASCFKALDRYNSGYLDLQDLRNWYQFEETKTRKETNKINQFAMTSRLPAKTMAIPNSMVASSPKVAKTSVRARTAPANQSRDFDFHPVPPKLPKNAFAMTRSSFQDPPKTPAETPLSLPDSFEDDKSIFHTGMSVVHLFEEFSPLDTWRAGGEQSSIISHNPKNGKIGNQTMAWEFSFTQHKPGIAYVDFTDRRCLDFIAKSLREGAAGIGAWIFQKTAPEQTCELKFLLGSKEAIELEEPMPMYQFEFGLQFKGWRQLVVDLEKDACGPGCTGAGPRNGPVPRIEMMRIIAPSTSGHVEFGIFEMTSSTSQGRVPDYQMPDINSRLKEDASSIRRRALEVSRVYRAPHTVISRVQNQKEVFSFEEKRDLEIIEQRIDNWLLGNKIEIEVADIEEKENWESKMPQIKARQTRAELLRARYHSLEKRFTRARTLLSELALVSSEHGWTGLPLLSTSSPGFYYKSDNFPNAIAVRGGPKEVHSSHHPQFMAVAMVVNEILLPLALAYHTRVTKVSMFTGTEVQEKLDENGKPAFGLNLNKTFFNNEDVKTEIYNVLDYLNFQGFAEGSSLALGDDEGATDGSTQGLYGYFVAIYLMRRQLMADQRLERETRTMWWYSRFNTLFLDNAKRSVFIDSTQLYRLLFILCQDSQHPDKLAMTRRWLSWTTSALKVTTDSSDTIKPDGTLYRYGGPGVLKGLGEEALCMSSLLVYLTRETEFSVALEAQANLKKALLAARIICGKNDAPLPLCGQHALDCDVMQSLQAAYLYLDSASEVTEEKMPAATSAAHPVSSRKDTKKETKKETKKDTKHKGRKGAPPPVQEEKAPQRSLRPLALPPLRDPQLSAVFLRLFDPAALKAEEHPHMEELWEKYSDDGSWVDRHFTRTLGAIQLVADVSCAAARAERKPEQAPEGHYLFPFAGMSVHRKSDWTAVVKGHGRNVWNAFGGPRPAVSTRRVTSQLRCLLGHFISHGSLFLHCEEFSAPLGCGWDWTRVPGATTVALPVRQLFQLTHNSRQFNSQSLFGGLSIGNQAGVFALRIAETQSFYTLRCHKSFYFFNDTIVCLGSNIQGSHGVQKTQTTLFQNPISSDQATFVDSSTPITGLDYNHRITKKCEKTFWIQDTQGNGYVVPNSTSMGLTITRREQVDQLSKLSPEDFEFTETKVEDKNDVSAETSAFETAWLDHGIGPKSNDYEYAILVKSTLEKIGAFVSKPDYVVLRKDRYAHVVQCRSARCTAYTIFSVESAINVKGPVHATDRPCLVAVTNTTRTNNFAQAFGHGHGHGKFGNGVDNERNKESITVSLTHLATTANVSTEVKPVAANKDNKQPDPNARPVTLVLAGMWSLASSKPVEPEEPAYGKGKGKKKPAKKRPPSAKKGKKGHVEEPVVEAKKELEVETEDCGNVRLVQTDSQTMLTVFLLNATKEVKLVSAAACAP